MTKKNKKILRNAVMATLAIIFLLYIGRVFYLIDLGFALARDAKSGLYVQVPEDPDMRILIIGESTTVGAGADRPIDTIPGLIGKTFPDAELVNLGVNGRKTYLLLKDLEKISDSYDLVIIQAGGNDVIKFTQEKNFDRDLTSLVKKAKIMSPKVVVISIWNVGNAPIFPKGTRWLFDDRTTRFHAVTKRVAEEQKVSFIDIYEPHEVDTLGIAPDKYYAQDLFHPTTDGYAYWYESIEPVLIDVVGE